MMAESLADQIIQKVNQAAELYHRLILVVAPAGRGKTTALQDVRDRTGVPLVNVNLELSRRMLELTELQRTLQLLPLLREIVGNGGDEAILLDNIEVIFDISLRQDPLRLLQGTLPQQDRGGRMERHYRWRFFDLCRSVPPGVQTLSDEWFPSGKLGGDDMKPRNSTAREQMR